MDLRQLRYFIAVAEELHFGRAAERCHIAQPPLSRAIKQLEENLGAPLFRRTNRKVELTREGSAFLRTARTTIDTLEEGAKTVRMMARGETGSLSVGFVSSSIHTPFPRAIKAFREEYPSINLSLMEMPSYLQMDAIRTGELDVGLIRTGKMDITHFDAQEFFTESYVLALPSDHPLAGRDGIELLELDGEPLIMFPRHYQPNNYDAILGSFDRAGAVMNVVQETRTHQTKVALVSAGLGIGVVPQSIATACPAGVSLIPSVGKVHLPVIDYTLIWKKGDRATTLDRFEEVMERCSRENC